MSKKIVLDKKLLSKLYLKDLLTADQIAEMLKVGRGVVYTNLRDYNIPRRKFTNKGKIGILGNAWKGHGQLGLGHWNWIKRKAKARNIQVLCSIKDVWNQFVKQHGKCALTGIQLTMPIPFIDKIKHNASLDRINSDKPYKVGNIQWVDKRINIMKNVFPQKEFITLCQMVTTFRS